MLGPTAIDHVLEPFYDPPTPSSRTPTISLAILDSYGNQFNAKKAGKKARSTKRTRSKKRGREGGVSVSDSVCDSKCSNSSENDLKSGLKSRKSRRLSRPRSPPPPPPKSPTCSLLRQSLGSCRLGASETESKGNKNLTKILTMQVGCVFLHKFTQPTLSSLAWSVSLEVFGAFLSYSNLYFL